MRKTAFRFAVTLGLLCAPITAFAFVPPNVTGLSAGIHDGQIAIRWDVPEGENDIGLYRIYYGQKSILENDGAYDDFLAINGDRNELIITDLPPYPEIYMAVVAVNSADEESDSFMEEVHLDLTQPTFDGDVRTREAPSPARKLREEGMLGLVSAKNTSMNDISLTFTHDVQVAPDQASDAVSITDSNGQPLKISKLVLLGSQMQVQTDPLELGMAYAIRVNPVVMGFIAPDRVLPLDPARSIGSLTAEVPVPQAQPDPGEPAPTEEPQAPTADVGSTETEIHNFRTLVEPEGSTGRSTVIVGWDAPTVGIVKSYKLTPIVGKKMGNTTEIGPETTVVRFRKIPGGLFRVAVLTQFEDGSTAGPTTISLTIAGDVLPETTTILPTIVKPGSTHSVGGGLATTGIGISGIAAVSGVLTGLKHLRRKRKIRDAMEPISGLS